MQVKKDANKIAKQVFIHAGIKFILDRHKEGKITWHRQTHEYVKDLITKKTIIDKEFNIVQFDRLSLLGTMSTALNLYHPCNLLYHLLRRIVPPIAGLFTTHEPSVYLMGMPKRRDIRYTGGFFVVSLSADLGVGC